MLNKLPQRKLGPQFALVGSVNAMMNEPRNFQAAGSAFVQVCAHTRGSHRNATPRSGFRPVITGRPAAARVFMDLKMSTWAGRWTEQAWINKKQALIEKI